MVFSAYLFGIPALYIVLSDCRKREYAGYHGAQAFLLWAIFFMVFFTLRFNLDRMLMIRYAAGAEWIEPIFSAVLGGYALFCGIRAFAGFNFRIPF